MSLQLSSEGSPFNLCSLQDDELVPCSISLSSGVFFVKSEIAPSYTNVAFAMLFAWSYRPKIIPHAIAECKYALNIILSISMVL
jgi:hypothetical protein